MPESTTPYVLPDKPSELLLIALEDLEKCEEDPDYAINMLLWHSPRMDGRCSVCMAGAVLAKRLGFHKDTTWNTFVDHREGGKLAAINALRVGAVELARLSLGISIPLESRGMPGYGEPEFKPAIRQLAADLAEVGF